MIQPKWDNLAESTKRSMSMFNEQNWSPGSEAGDWDTEGHQKTDTMSWADRTGALSWAQKTRPDEPRVNPVGGEGDITASKGIMGMPTDLNPTGVIRKPGEPDDPQGAGLGGDPQYAPETPREGQIHCEGNNCWSYRNGKWELYTVIPFQEAYNAGYYRALNEQIGDVEPLDHPMGGGGGMMPSAGSEIKPHDNRWELDAFAASIGETITSENIARIYNAYIQQSQGAGI